MAPVALAAVVLLPALTAALVLAWPALVPLVTGLAVQAEARVLIAARRFWEQVRYSLAPGRYAVPVPAHIDSGGA
jgi:hypothetical protein